MHAFLASPQGLRLVFNGKDPETQRRRYGSEKKAKGREPLEEEGKAAEELLSRHVPPRFFLALSRVFD